MCFVMKFINLIFGFVKSRVFVEFFSLICLASPFKAKNGRVKEVILKRGTIIKLVKVV